MDTGKLGLWYFFDGQSSSDVAAAAKRIESLGYGTLWIPETVGKSPVALASWILANTTTLNVATGIINIYHREPGVTMAAQKSLAEQSDGRFLLGMGVSHKPLVEGVRGLNYGPPVATMKQYLEGMRAAPYTAVTTPDEPPLVIAALGPKMLELAASHCQGAHPYFTSPEHTAMAREIMGPEPWLCVEQKVILETDPAKARELAKPVAKIYNRLPNYRNNWFRMGLSEDDCDNLTDKFIDTTFAWGSVENIQARIQAHFDAGATHVVYSTGQPQRAIWRPALGSPGGAGTTKLRAIVLKKIIPGVVVAIALLAYAYLAFVGIEPKDRRPGTKLSGTTAVLPQDLAFVDNKMEVTLETQPWYGIPFSVTTVIVRHGGTSTCHPFTIRRKLSRVQNTGTKWLPLTPRYACALSNQFTN